MLDPRGGLAGELAQRAAPRPGTGEGSRPSKRALAAAAGAVERAAADWSKAPKAVGAVARDRSLGSRDRRAATDLAWEVVRWRRLLERLVGTVPRDLVRAAAVLLADAPEDLLAPELRGPLRDPAHELLGDVLLRGADEATTLGVATSLPDWFAARLLAEHPPDEAIVLARALLERAPLTLRVHRDRAERDAVAAELAAAGVDSTPSPLAPDALTLDGHVNVRSLGPVQRGEASVQDAGSQAVVELVGATPGMRVLDACAGAGGKTLALASTGARVLGTDVRKDALGEGMRRAREAGVSDRVRLLPIPPTGPLPDALFKSPADAVLVDAPCTGSGALRREPHARWSRSPLELERMPKRQRGILARFAPAVAEGGALVYATCSLFGPENRDVVDAFLAEHPEFSLEEERSWRPDRDGCDGFYAARLRRG